MYFRKKKMGINIIRKPISSQPNKCFGIGSPIVINETTTVYTGYHIFKVWIRQISLYNFVHTGKHKVN
jgi:hypothetical protein